MGLETIRRDIDKIDNEIIGLLARRAKLVETVAEIKKDRSQVRDEKRIGEVISRVRAQAEKTGIDPDFAEELYRAIIEYFVSFEMKKFEKG